MNSYWVDTCGDDSEQRLAREIQRLREIFERYPSRTSLVSESLDEQAKRHAAEEAARRRPTWWPFRKKRG